MRPWTPWPRPGAEIVEVSCPNFRYALGAYYLIMPSEVSSNLARFDAMRYGLRVGDDGTAGAEEVMARTRGAGFGDEVKRRIIIGTYALSSGYYDAYYGSAQKARTLIARDFENGLREVGRAGLAVHADHGVPDRRAHRRPAGHVRRRPVHHSVQYGGQRGGSFPCGLAPEDGLPVGFQVMAPVLADDRVYRVGAALERELAARWGGLLTDQLWARENGADENGGAL